MKVLVLGYSKSGKTAAAEIIAKIIKSPPPRNCSDFIIEDFAVESTKSSTGTLSPMKALKLAKEISANKDPYRQDLFKYGLKRQAEDPAYPVSEAVQHTDVVTGVRTIENLNASRKFFDVILWIDRDGVNKNSTDNLGPENADKIIENNGTFKDLEVALIGALA